MRVDRPTENSHPGRAALRDKYCNVKLINKGDQMVLSENLVHEYQKMHKRKFGKEISTKVAERELFDLAGLVRLIIKERKKHHDN